MAGVKSDNALSRYASRMRKISTTKTRSSWRHRAAQRYKKTPTEKALLKAKRKQHRTEYTEALAAARNVVMEQATLLREKFGRHLVNYYFEEIMQRSRIRKGTRKANKWNTFVKKQVELHNAGMFYFYLFFPAISTYHYSITGWREASQGM